MTLYLVDASGLIHRAFHAIKGLRTRAGVPTNAVYGLASMLRKFAKENRPERCAVVFDAGRETFRNEMYADYKATRPPTDPDLAVQFEPARRIAEALGFPCVEVEGYEADDVIATLAMAARQAGMNVVIESGDKDLFQLVGDGITAHDPMRDRVFDPAGVVEKMGVPPDRIIDYLALVGDASDNVPGVRGIGAKGAAELINAFGGLDDIYGHLDELPPRKREALEAGRATAVLSRVLVTLATDVPLPLGLEDLAPRPPDRAALVALLTELEFKGLLTEVLAEGGLGQADLFAAAGGGADDSVDRSAPPIASPIEVGPDGDRDAVVRAVGEAGAVALAASFGARDPVRPACRGLGIAADGETFVLRPDDLDDAFFGALAGVLGERPFVAAHSKELGQVFAARGARMPLPVFDPVLASYLLHAERDSHALETVLLEELGRPLPGPQEPSSDAVAARARAAQEAADLLAPRIKEQGLRALLDDVEIPLARLLGEMERTGVPVDREALGRLSVELGHDLQRLEKSILDAAGVPFNPNSPKQLAEVLFKRLQLPVVKKTKTGPSTDVTVLEELADRHPVPALILEYRSLAKLKGTYADALAGLVHPITGRIHTSYNQAVAATGRLSSSDPNLQNIPIRTDAGRKIRAAFVAAPGTAFVSADYSQIELRVLAHLSGDESLIEAFREGRDIHARTAARVFRCAEADVTPDMRRTAKVVNFGLLYGMGPFRLGRDLKIPQSEAKRIIDDYFGAFPRVRAFLDGTLESARTSGFVMTLTGRRRAADGINASKHQERASAERMALNMPIQGLAADIIKVAMVRLRERLLEAGLDARIVLQVHDELVLECAQDQADRVADLLRDTMQGAYPLSVPLAVEVGRGRVWSDLHG